MIYVLTNPFIAISKKKIKRNGGLSTINTVFKYHRQVADERGLQLVAYEGGQHIVGGKKQRMIKNSLIFLLR